VQAIGARKFLLEVTASRVEFDIWSTHPYTSGNAFHKSFSADGVSMGDLPAVRAILDQASREGRIVSDGPVGFWVDEFGWDSSPPDPRGVPKDLLVRWTAEAVYQAWRSGVSALLWFQLRDDLPSQTIWQGGLYTACDLGVGCDQPKPHLLAFRFPFVAYREPPRQVKRSRRTVPGKVLVWGRTPGGYPSTVVIEQQRHGQWVKLVKVKTDGDGIIHRRVRTSRNGALRARTSRKDVAVPFSLTVPPDRPGTTPFGTT
jgi:hypothetical protein